MALNYEYTTSWMRTFKPYTLVHMVNLSLSSLVIVWMKTELPQMITNLEIHKYITGALFYN
jgi:hypothetical protein